MTRPQIHDFNVATGEVTVREMNDEEYAQHLKDAEDYARRQAEEKAAEEAKAEAKASALAKLAALGLSEEEAKAIAG